MTKSRTLRKAGAVALSLAMALSIAGTTPAQAASKVKLSSKKGTITVGKTKKVTIKNTKKSNIKKVTFKYSNTKKRVTAKRSGLTLKFTGKKAGTVTITSKITLKKAVAGKKVYSLKYKATVKKAKPAPTATPAELKIEKVEGATDAATYKYIVVKFNQKFTSLEPSEIDIRRVSDDQKFMVEKVVLDADGKGATITLLGDQTKDTTQFLQGNVEYKMTVTQNGKAAEKVFTLPVVWPNEVVTAVDKSKKQFTIWGTNTFTLNDDLAASTDFQELLGRTVTIRFDKNNVVDKLTLKDETVVYGSFENTDGNTIKDLKTKTTYTLQKEDISDAIYATREYTLDKGDFVSAAKGNNVDYAKVVLNGNGTVRTIVSVDTWSDSKYVVSVKDNDINDIANMATSLKDFIIVKGGKQIAVADIQAGDVVYFDKDNKYAEVYVEGSVKGKLSVLDGKFDVDTTRYDTKGQLVANKKEEDATNTNLKAFVGSNVTVFFKRNGDVSKIVPDGVVSNTSTSLGVITTAAKVYASGSKHLIDVSVTDKDGKKDYTIDPATLTSITASSGLSRSTASKVKADNTIDADDTQNTNSVTGFGFEKGDYNAATFSGTLAIKRSVAGAAQAYAGSDDMVTVGGAANDMGAGKLIKLTKKEDGTVTGIDLGGNVGSGDANIYADVPLGKEGANNQGAAAVVSLLDGSASATNTFGKGAKAVTSRKYGASWGNDKTASLTSAVPVLIYDATAKTVKAITYGEVDFSFTIDGDNVTATNSTADGYVRFAGDKVDSILIYAGNAGISTDSTTTERCIIADSVFDLSTPATLDTVKLAYGTGDVVEYSKAKGSFANDITQGTASDWNKGTPVEVKKTKEGKITEIKKIATGAAYTKTGFDTAVKNTFEFVAGGKKLISSLDSSITATIVTVTGGVGAAEDKKTVTPITWSAYCDQKAADVAKVEAWAYSGNYCDLVVVTLTTDAQKDSASIAKTLDSLPAYLPINGAKNALTLPYASTGKDETNGTTVTWESDTASATNGVTNAGAIKGTGANSTLTATIKKGDGTTKTQTYAVKVSGGLFASSTKSELVAAVDAEAAYRTTAASTTGTYQLTGGSATTFDLATVGESGDPNDDKVTITLGLSTAAATAGLSLASGTNKKILTSAATSYGGNTGDLTATFTAGNYSVEKTFTVVTNGSDEIATITKD